MLAALRLEETDRISIAPRGIDPFGSGMLNEPSYQILLDYARKHFDIWHSWSPVVNESAFLSSSKEAKSRTETWTEGRYEIRKRIIETPNGCLSSVHNRRIGNPYRCVKPLIKTDEDLRTFLAIPYEPLKIDISPFVREKQRLGDAGVLMTEAPEPLFHVVDLFNYEDFVQRTMRDRKSIVFLMDLMYERCFDCLTRILESGARDVFGVTGPEYVAPPMFNPRFFEDLVVKYDRRLIELIHEYDGIVYLHCHGSVNAILEKIAEMGADSLHPVEPPPLGDTPLREAKRRIGDKVCFIGNVQIGDVLSASKEEIDRSVRQAICEGGPDGFILSTSASPHWWPLPEKAFENYRQLTETALDYGRLPRRSVGLINDFQ